MAVEVKNMMDFKMSAVMVSFSTIFLSFFFDVQKNYLGEIFYFESPRFIFTIFVKKFVDPIKNFNLDSSLKIQTHVFRISRIVKPFQIE